MSQFSVPFIISEMTRKQPVNGDKLLFGGYSATENSAYIVDPVIGTLIWKSPSLLGEINGISYQGKDISGENYMALSARNAIYLTR